MIATETQARHTGCNVGAYLEDDKIALMVVYRKNGGLEKIRFGLEDDLSAVIERVEKRSGKDWNEQIQAGVQKWINRIEVCSMLKEMIEAEKVLDVDYLFWDYLYDFRTGSMSDHLSQIHKLDKLYQKTSSVEIACMQKAIAEGPNEKGKNYLSLFRFIKRAKKKYNELEEYQILTLNGILQFSSQLLGEYNSSEWDIANQLFSEI